MCHNYRSEVTVKEETPAQIEAPIEQDNSNIGTTPQQRQQKISEFDFSGLSDHDRVVKVLGLFPNLSIGS